MIVEANIKRLDLLKMQVYLLFRVPANLYFFALIWIAMAIVSWSLLGKYGLAVYLLSVSIVAVFAFLAGLPFTILMQLVLATEKQGFIGPHTFEIRDDAFVEVSSGSSTTTRWGNIARIFVFRKYLFVMISMYRVHIVPRRAFRSDDEFRQFIDAVQSRIESG